MAAQTGSQVNLLPTDRFEYSKLGRFLSWALTAGRYAVVVTELVVIAAFLSRFWFDRKLTNLRELRMQKETVVNSFNEVLDKFLRTQSRLATVRRVLAGQFDAENNLATLQSMTPKGVEYTNIIIASGSATAKGFVSSASAFSLFLSNVQRAVTPEKVTVKSLTLSEQRTPGFDFELVILGNAKSAAQKKQSP